MEIVLGILVLAILLIIAIVRTILKRDDNEPPCPDAELPDAEYPELQLHSGTRHQPGREIEFHSREPEQEYKTKPRPRIKSHILSIITPPGGATLLTGYVSRRIGNVMNVVSR